MSPKYLQIQIVLQNTLGIAHNISMIIKIFVTLHKNLQNERKYLLHHTNTYKYKNLKMHLTLHKY